MNEQDEWNFNDSQTAQRGLPMLVVLVIMNFLPSVSSINGEHRTLQLKLLESSLRNASMSGYATA